MKRLKYPLVVKGWIVRTQYLVFDALNADYFVRLRSNEKRDSLRTNQCYDFVREIKRKKR